MYSIRNVVFSCPARGLTRICSELGRDYGNVITQVDMNTKGYFRSIPKAPKVPDRTPCAVPQSKAVLASGVSANIAPRLPHGLRTLSKFLPFAVLLWSFG